MSRPRGATLTVGLLLPGLSAPPLRGSLLMLVAGVAWGIYYLRGKGSGDPLRATAGLAGIALVIVQRQRAL